MKSFDMKLHIVLVTPLVGLIAGCATFESNLEAQGFERQNSTEILSILIDNTLVGEFVGSENTYILYFRADGTLRGMSISPSGSVQKDDGRWKASEDDMFCDQWKKWQAGSDCDRIYLRGDEVVLVNTDGTKSSFGTLERGNSRGL